MGWHLIQGGVEIQNNSPFKSALFILTESTNAFHSTNYLFGPIFQLVPEVFFRRLVVLVEILAQINKPSTIVSALQSV